MRRVPGQRDLRALELRNYTDSEDTQRQSEQQYSPRYAPKPATPHSTDVTKSMQPPKMQTANFGKGISSSDQSINQAVSRSLSMINLPSPRVKPFRLRAGSDRYSCEEEEKKRFYHSIDPSMEFDDFELDLEPPRPTRQQTARLRAGSPIRCPPPAEQNACPDNYSRQSEQYSRPPNFSTFFPQGSPGPGRGGSPNSTRRSSFDQYSSLPARAPSTMRPNMSSWSPPMMQSSTMSRQSSRPRYGQETSSVLYESPRRNQYAPQTTMNSTRCQGIPGQPFKMPGLSPQSMATQWFTPPGSMPSGFGQQSSVCQASSPRPSRWDPPTCPKGMDRPLQCPAKDEGPCPKEHMNVPCEGCEEDNDEEESFKSPPRCKPLDPEIMKKLCPDLVPFKIPKCMEDEFFCAKRREQWDTLVKDQNCPGAIQATIDGLFNFNVLAYDIVFGDMRLPDCLTHIDPITLLEAFCMRINYERCQIRKLEQATYAKENPDDDDPKKQPPPSDDCTLIEKCFKRKHPTDLNKAIESLLKAEKGFDFQNPNPELPSMSLVLDKTSVDLPGIPITIKAYTGYTKPRN